MEPQRPAYSAEKGYQFAKKDGTRDPSKPFTEDIYSNYNNNIRLDLTLAAAGAWYGAGSLDAGKSLSKEQLDEAFNLTFRGSQNLPRRAGFVEADFVLDNSRSTLSLYSDWQKIVNADAAYKFFQKQILP